MVVKGIGDISHTGPWPGNLSHTGPLGTPPPPPPCLDLPSPIRISNCGGAKKWNYLYFTTIMTIHGSFIDFVGVWRLPGVCGSAQQPSRPLCGVSHTGPPSWAISHTGLLGTPPPPPPYYNPLYLPGHGSYELHPLWWRAELGKLALLASMYLGL